MGSHRGLGDPQHLGDVGHATRLHDRMQHAHLGPGQLVDARDGLERRRDVERRLAYEDGGGGRVQPRRSLPHSRCQRHHVREPPLRVLGPERYRRTARAQARAAPIAVEDGVAELAVRLLVDGGEPVRAIAQESAAPDQLGGGRIGEHDVGAHVHDEYSRGEAVERVGQHRLARCLLRNEMADRGRPQHVRDDEPQPPLGFVIHHPVPFPADDRQRRHAGHALLEIGNERVRHTLRAHPFAVEAGAPHLGRGNDVVRVEDDPGRDECRCRVERIHLGVGLEIRLQVVRLDADALEDAGAFLRHVLPIEVGGTAADEIADASQGAGPQLGLQGRVVDDPDQV